MTHQIKANLQESLPKTVGNLPDTALIDDRWYFFDVRHPDWRKGKWNRLKKKYRDAKRLVNLDGYEVRLSKSQEGPTIGDRGLAGSQKAMVYGGRKRNKAE